MGLENIFQKDAKVVWFYLRFYLKILKISNFVTFITIKNVNAIAFSVL